MGTPESGGHSRGTPRGEDPTMAPVELGWRCWEVFEASGDGVVVTDHQGQIIFVNPTLMAMSGYRAEDLLGRVVEVLVPDASREGHDARHRAYRADPYPRMMGHGPRLQLRRHDGSTLDVEIALAPMGTAMGARTVATVRDITDRVALQAKAARLLALLDLVPDPVMILDAGDLRVAYANPALLELTGHSRDAVVGHPVERISHRRGDADPRATIDQLARADHAVEVVDVTVTTAAGEPVPVELHHRLVVDRDGARHVVGVARDMRARTANEERLRASEEAFRTAFEKAPIGVAVLATAQDGDRSIILANRGLADMFGCSVAELIGGDLSPYSAPDDDGDDTASLTDGARPTTDGYSRLKRYRRADGSPLWAEVRGTAFALPDMPGPLLLAHWVDVTDRVTQQRREAQEGLINACVAEVATAALAGEPESAVLGRIVSGATQLLHAASCGLALRDPSGEYRWEAVTGEPVTLVGPVGSPVADALLRRGLRIGHTVTLPTPPAVFPEATAGALGPVAVAPFGSQDGVAGGFLASARRPGSAAYTPADAADLTRLAAQTQLAVHLARAQSAQKRLAVLRDRQRIARELHDRVLQDIIAVGMRLAAEADRQPDPDLRDRGLERVEELEQIVRQLRRVVFETRVSDQQAPLDAVHALIAEAERILGHRPDLVVHGSVDALPVDLVDDVLAVLRESLANIARHAHAAHTRITLDVGADQVSLIVDDDGAGVTTHPRQGYGVVNMKQRASARDGSAELGPRPGGGTRLTWTCARRPDAPAGPRR